MQFMVTATQEYGGPRYFTTTLDTEDAEAAIRKFGRDYAHDPRQDDLELHIPIPAWGGKTHTINLMEALHNASTAIAIADYYLHLTPHTSFAARF